jgi:cation transport regulator ChaB
MPYDTLPERLRAIIPSKAGQDIFRNTVNSQLAAGKSEEVAMASAWAALQRAGYDKDENGNWTTKMQPTASQVHVPGTEWDDDDDDAEKGKKPKDYARKASGAAPIYMYRSVLNAEQIHEWAAAQGFARALPLDDLHVTVVFSKAAFSADLSALAATHGTVHYNNVVVRGGKRAVVPLGDRGAVVLKIQSDELQYEHLMFRAMGASWDFQEYTPHISITYQGRDLPLANMQPFMGDIVLGPLRAKPMNTNWDAEISEVALDVSKRMMNDDTFTTSAEAAVRSMDLGLDGEIHVHQTADGQAVYMPGASHKVYLERMAVVAGVGDSGMDDEEDSAQSSPDLLQRVISAILAATMEHNVAKASDILKVDKARRIVWGWASVSTMKGELVTDRQGDRIAPAEMEKMADGFMRSARAAKAMHDGDDVGEVIHSLPLTKELADALGIQTDREGWVTGTYIKSDAEWQKVLRGEYAGLSIGGRAKRKERAE